MKNEIKEDEHYYENSYNLIDNILEFDRVYMVDENKFEETTYKDLASVYENLPYFIKDPTYFPCWYGDEDK